MTGRRHAGGRIASTLALVALTGAGAVSAAEPVAHLRLGYDVYYRIIRVASLHSDSTFGPHSYRTETTARTEGIVGTLFPWTLRSESRGDIDSASLRPAAHHTESTYRGQVWRVEMEYRDGAPPRVELEGPPRRDDGDEVPAPLRAATVDPLTATLVVLRAVAAGEGCATIQRVFDGRRRYDVRYEDLGSVELQPSSYRTYAGPARLCRSTLEPIAGFPTAGRTAGVSLVTQSWIAPPVPGAAPVPVQLELTGRAGTLLFYLRAADLKPP